MNSRLNTFKASTIITLLMLFLLSCNDTIPNRSLISAGSTTDPTTCDEGFTYDTTTATCVADAVTRPKDAVFWKDDFCICKDQKAYSSNSCSSFCSTKSTGGLALLYANFTVGAAISLNTSFNNINGWCTATIAGATGNAGCALAAKDSEGNTKSADLTSITNNSIIVNVSDLIAEDKTYQLRLYEKSSCTTSGDPTTCASSDIVQTIRYSVDVGSTALGVLKNASINQYTCIVKTLTTATTGSVTDVYSDSAYRLHFYFLPSMPPTTVAAGTLNLVCHDPIANGTNDSEEFPRLELKTDVFRLWDKLDPRFYDNTGNNVMDVNDIIIQKTKNYGSTITAGTNFFASFTWPGSPTVSTQSGDTTTATASPSIGYYMAPWIDTTTYLSYCLNSTHFSGTNALFRAIGDVVQSDTEGLYVGEKAAETITNSDGTTTTGVKDYILVRETDIKQVWFYLKSSVPTKPTDANIASNAVYFYYPFNFSTPFVKSSSQRLYRVRGASELSTTSGNTTSGTDSGTKTAVPPHDRRIGCIPKI